MHTILTLYQINYNLATKPPQANRVEKSYCLDKTVARILS